MTTTTTTAQPTRFAMALRAEFDADMNSALGHLQREAQGASDFDRLCGCGSPVGHCPILVRYWKALRVYAEGWDVFGLGLGDWLGTLPETTVAWLTELARLTLLAEEGACCDMLNEAATRMFKAYREDC